MQRCNEDAVKANEDVSSSHIMNRKPRPSNDSDAADDWSEYVQLADFVRYVSWNEASRNANAIYKDEQYG